MPHPVCVGRLIAHASDSGRGIPGRAGRKMVRSTRITTWYQHDTLHLHMQGNPPHGGPLFWSQYSYLGLDPRGLKDRYADYWKENLTQTLINYTWCVDNPKHFKESYGKDNWGLTASYSVVGYAAHAPDEQKRPGRNLADRCHFSHALYAPETIHGGYLVLVCLSSREALGHNMVFMMPLANRPRLVSAALYLAIDQGPEVDMIENYRSGLLWRLFMRLSGSTARIDLDWASRKSPG